MIWIAVAKEHQKRFAASLVLADGLVREPNKPVDDLPSLGLSRGRNAEEVTKLAFRSESAAYWKRWHTSFEPGNSFRILACRHGGSVSPNVELSGWPPRN